MFLKLHLIHAKQRGKGQCWINRPAIQEQVRPESCCMPGGLQLSCKRQISKRIASFGIRKNFLNRIQKVLIIKEKISKLLYTKIKNLTKKGKPLFTEREGKAKIQNGKRCLWYRKLTKSSNPEYTNKKKTTKWKNGQET